jgi:hypothetical protein
VTSITILDGVRPEFGELPNIRDIVLDRDL